MQFNENKETVNIKLELKKYHELKSIELSLTEG